MSRTAPRRDPQPAPAPTAATTANADAAGASPWTALRIVWPFLRRHRWRVAAAFACLIAAKLANVGVPIVLKHIVDLLTPVVTAASQGGAPTAAAAGLNAGGHAVQPGATPAALIVPFGVLLAYGLLRLGTTAFGELREILFARVTQGTVRAVALQVFEHLHALSLRFHLDRQTGGLTRDLERGTQGIASLASYTLYSIIPTLIEFGLVLGYLAWHYEWSFTLITLAALAGYIVFTITVTEWRSDFRRRMNELDSEASIRAVDSLLNYETVKYFNNEAYEARRYDQGMRRWEQAAVRSQVSLAALNIGQAAIIATAVTLMVWRASVGVAEGRLSLGDLVLINAFLIQLYAPLNFLGMIYRQIRQSLTDVERMASLLRAEREVADAPDARPIRLTHPGQGPGLRFEHVRFGYDPAHPVLEDVSFTVAPGTTTALVGPSGAGKSTLARLLFRFHDVQGGAILIDDQDLRALTLDSLRAAIGVVPQDTVLFNDSLRYNVAYGRPTASDAEIDAAIRAARLDDFIARLPLGGATPVGERGLKLSGGEKQRVAIARTLLKNPPLLILDEATSALDSSNEQAIQLALRGLAEHRTTLTIAHRLSTVVDADQILVLDRGRIVERGRHAELLARDGLYARLWRLQAEQAPLPTDPLKPNPTY